MISNQSYFKANSVGNFIVFGLILSLILHLGLSYIFASSFRMPPEPKRIEAIDVFFEPAEEPQIINEPESPESETEPPETTKFLSEKDHFTEKEQVKRGDGLDAAPQVASKPKAPAKPAPKPQAKPESDPEPVAKKLILKNPMVLEPQEEKPVTESTLRDVPTKPFSRPAGSGAAFLGTTGTNDFLPNLPDGDITLLNAKADRFAVFVRRVATRVFSDLRIAGWETLRPEEVASISGYTTVHAVLSPQGKFLLAEIRDDSGSKRFDVVVANAVKSGASDPNPPPEAAATDGNFHFIFRAKSWVAFGGGRSGMQQRRWLMLGTGLL